MRTRAQAHSHTHTCSHAHSSQYDVASTSYYTPVLIYFYYIVGIALFHKPVVLCINEYILRCTARNLKLHLSDIRNNYTWSFHV